MSYELTVWKFKIYNLQWTIKLAPNDSRGISSFSITTKQIVRVFRVDKIINDCGRGGGHVFYNGLYSRKRAGRIL